MSETTSFSYPKPFPFSPSDALAPDLAAGDNYVELTETEGDSGLAEARRIWWNLESVQFTVQWETEIASVPATSYDETIDWPENMGGGTYFSYDVRGSIVASADDVSAQPAAAPEDRIPFSSPLCINANAVKDWPLILVLTLAYVDSRWRLYYRFEFSLASEQWVTNPAYPGITDPIVTSGTFTLLGYDLSYVFRALGGDAPDFEVTSISVSASSVAFTYPA